MVRWRDSEVVGWEGARAPGFGSLKSWYSLVHGSKRYSGCL